MAAQIAARDMAAREVEIARSFWAIIDVLCQLFTDVDRWENEGGKLWQK